MLTIYNNIIPLRGFKAINICGVLFARKGAAIDAVTINHESIHTRQMLECLVVGFYLLYVLNWAVNLFRYGLGKEAYRQILFEQEAYKHQSDMEYLKDRKPFAWIR